MKNKKILYKSELSIGKKKHFLIGLGIYVLGFLVLQTIGDDINENGYIIRAFVAPFLILTAIIYIPYNLFKK